MISSPAFQQTLGALAQARQLASYAQDRGVSNVIRHHRPASTHLGAALADCILQAGLNYHTVVRSRVERIVEQFPDAESMTGIIAVIQQGATSNFLMWRHPEKIQRFIKLALVLHNNDVGETDRLRDWIQARRSRDKLLRITGIGPKTVDYLACLVGVDCIPIDRHLRVFAEDAGIAVRDYEDLKLVFSYAADLLEMPRRTFDRWIWEYGSAKLPKRVAYM
jgi:hypothetical protein